jgi:radical SAM superfamily enzyme YgiQ (UPF0313 family)
LIDAPARGWDALATLAHAREFAPGLVVMDTSTPSLVNDLAVAAQIKAALPGVFIVAVGTHVSALAGQTLEMGPALDAVARREYEYTVRELAGVVAAARGRAHGLSHGQSLAPERLAEVAGLSWRGPAGVVHNPDRPFIADLDELPWVSKVYQRHLQIDDYFNPNAIPPMVTLITSRGCPFKCTFCVYPQTFTGRAYRFRSIADVVEEMAWVARAFPKARSIFFEDDTLTADKERCRQFSQAVIDRRLKLAWTANSRVSLDYDTMVLMRRAGCRQLCVGFESGDPDVLKTMKKGIGTEAMLRFMADARRAGLLIHGCFMLGFPGETKASVEKTIALALALKPDTVQFYPVMVYPGTEAYEEYERLGWLTACRWQDWLTPAGLHNCVVRNENLSSEEIVRLCDLARRRFYLRPGYFLYKLGQVLKSPDEFKRTARAGRTFFKHLLMGSRV